MYAPYGSQITPTIDSGRINKDLLAAAKHNLAYMKANVRYFPYGELRYGCLREIERLETAIMRAEDGIDRRSFLARLFNI